MIIHINKKSEEDIILFLQIILQVCKLPAAKTRVQNSVWTDYQKIKAACIVTQAAPEFYQYHSIRITTIPG